MNFSKGQLVRWKTPVELGDDDRPCVIIKGPYEGYFEKKPVTQLVLVVDLLVDDNVVRGIPLQEIEKWS